MTAVYIIVGLILLLAVLLLIPVFVYAEFSGEFSAKIKYGFITVFDTEKKKPKRKDNKHEKQNKPKEKPKSKSKKKSKPSLLFEKKKSELGLFGAIKYFLDILKDLLARILWLVKRIDFKHFKLDLTVASDDAAKTAVTYGEVCTAVYPILSLLNANTNLSLKQVNICADFNKTAIDAEISVILKTRLIYFAIMGIKTLFAYKNLIKEVNDYE